MPTHFSAPLEARRGADGVSNTDPTDPVIAVRGLVVYGEQAGRLDAIREQAEQRVIVSTLLPTVRQRAEAREPVTFDVTLSQLRTDDVRVRQHRGHRGRAVLSLAPEVLDMCTRRQQTVRNHLRALNREFTRVRMHAVVRAITRARRQHPGQVVDTRHRTGRRRVDAVRIVLAIDIARQPAIRGEEALVALHADTQPRHGRGGVSITTANSEFDFVIRTRPGVVDDGTRSAREQACRIVRRIATGGIPHVRAPHATRVTTRSAERTVIREERLPEVARCDVRDDRRPTHTGDGVTRRRSRGQSARSVADDLVVTRSRQHPEHQVHTHRGETRGNHGNRVTRDVE